MSYPWQSTIDSLKGGLVVSCQAAPGTPTDSPEILASFAKSAEMAGAVGIRANYPRNIAAIARLVQLPIIGIIKREVPGYEVYITPEFSDSQEVAAAGAQIIALDATARPRPGAYGFPADRAAKIAVREVREFLKREPYVERVTFVCFDARARRAYDVALKGGAA